MGTAEAEESKKLGNEAFVAKKYDDAIKHYTEALTQDPENASFAAIIYSNRSACYAGKKDWQKAFEDANEALKKDSKFLKAYYRLSVAMCELGQFDDAIEILAVAYRIDGGSEMIAKALNNAKAKKSAAVRAAKNRKAAKQLDSAQQKEYMELQQQRATLMRDLSGARQRQMAMDKETKICESTSNHISAVEDGVPLYRAVGKCFMYQTKENVLTKMDSVIGSLKKQRGDLVDRQKYLERKIQSNANNINDMLQ